MKNGVKKGNIIPSKVKFKLENVQLGQLLSCPKKGILVIQLGGPFSFLWVRFFLNSLSPTFLSNPILTVEFQAAS